ncbi:DUF6705 family protein [Lacinutrix himadriensis]|uniref:DUF6705 family protein n=1 Tax=Lacinutrix himadriensis TaxID=641549 RepID=UPI0006E2BF7F|nr:DUF6705 family protein [Lacinutrix himadriensis]
MKNILFIVALTILTLSCKAQTPIIDISQRANSEIYIDLQDNCYLKDVANKLDPFLGTWVWTEGNNSLTITLEKIEMIYSNISKHYSDAVIGKYKYIENGVEIINTLDYNITAENAWDAHPTYIYRMLIPMLGGYNSDTKLHFHFSDYLKSKTENAYFKLLDLVTNPPLGNNPPTYSVSQAKLILQNSEHWNINGENPRDPEFTIPNNITLTKQ